MATVKKSIRVDKEAADRVSALKAEGESESSAYCRVIAAGLEALEGGQIGDKTADNSPTQADRIADLKETTEYLKSQIDAKDKQLERMQELVAQAHSLHKAEQEKVTALALPEPKKSLGRRIREFFVGAQEQN